MFARYRQTLILVLLFLVLFSYFWFVQKDKPAPTEDAQPTPAPMTALLNLKASEIGELNWNYASISATLTKKAEKQYQLSPAPVGQISADKAEQYINNVVGLNTTQKIAKSELNDQDAGIDNPSFTLTIKKIDGQSTLVKVGKMSIDQANYYVAVQGSDSQALVSTYLIDDLKKTAQDLAVDIEPSPTSTLSPQQ